MRATLAIALLLVAPLLLAPPAVAQPSIGANIQELVVRFRDNRTADFWINASIDGGAARQLRLLSDTNFSGTVSDVEANATKDLLRTLLVENSPDLARAQASLLLDERPPLDVGTLRLTVAGLEGSSRSTEPARAMLVTNVTWATPLNATPNGTHEFRIPEDAVVSSAHVTIEVPPGQEVGNVTGLDSAQVTDARDEVSGYAQPARALSVAYAPPPPEEDEAPEGADAPGDDGVPSAGVLVAAAALAGAALAARARTRRR